MSQGIASLHKILKDETRQKIISLLATRGSLSYTELMEQLDVLTGILNYHLKVLGDLLQKNNSGQYSLSDKGQVAYKVMTEFPNNQRQLDKRTYKVWIILFSAVVIVTLLNGYFMVVNIQRTILILAIQVLSFAFAFYIRLKPSRSGNRAFFIAIGAIGPGFVFWFLLTSLIMFSGLRLTIITSAGSIGDNFTVFATLIICWIAGGFVGDLLGKRRGYIIPMIRT